MKNYSSQRKESLSYRVCRLFRLSSCILDRRLASLGLWHGQVPYIITLVEEEGRTQNELAGIIRVNRAATARILKNMEAAGLVRREENPQNRREKLVYPTDKSRALADQLVAILDSYNEDIFEGFTDEERGVVLKLMDRALNNAQAVADGGGTHHG